MANVRTALHEAASFANTQVVRWLQHKGADLAAVNSAGETAAELAKRIGYADSVVAEMFRTLALKADVIGRSGIGGRVGRNEGKGRRTQSFASSR